MRQIKNIVIHCSASPNGRPVTIEDIDQWHRQRGFVRRHAGGIRPELKSVGYHHVIEVDGNIEPGRSHGEIGAHVQGSNANSIGICMIGTDKFTPEQWQALADLVQELRVTYPSAAVLGHRDFSPDKNGDGVIDEWEWTKICPGFDVRAWLDAGYVAPVEAVL